MEKEIDELKARRSNASKEIQKLSDQLSSNKKDRSKAYESDNEVIYMKHKENSNKYTYHIALPILSIAL
jgi:uncharacterized coiled-coil DUF342 family protein